MRWRLDTDDLKDAFSTEDITLIRDSFVRAAEWSDQFLRVDDVNVWFSVKKGFAEWWGVGAYAPDAHSISIFTHPEMFRLRKVEGYTRFSAVVAHELHHVMRWRGPAYGETLGQMMVSEGLALKFQRETGHPDFPDERYLNGVALRQMAEHAKPLLDGPVPEDQSVDHYLIGLHLIEAWSKYAGVTAAGACHVPADDVLNAWRSGEYDLSTDAASRPGLSMNKTGPKLKR